LQATVCQGTGEECAQGSLSPVPGFYTKNFRELEIYQEDKLFYRTSELTWVNLQQAEIPGPECFMWPMGNSRKNGLRVGI
jgi:hypothetical protein